MDGFKTTQMIIEKCKKNLVKLPYIIALTAIVDDEELRVRCQDSGLQ